MRVGFRRAFGPLLDNKQQAGVVGGLYSNILVLTQEHYLTSGNTTGATIVLVFVNLQPAIPAELGSAASGPNGACRLLWCRMPHATCHMPHTSTRCYEYRIMKYTGPNFLVVAMMVVVVVVMVVLLCWYSFENN